MKIERWVERQPAKVITMIITVSCLLIGFLDYMTPPEVELTGPFLLIVSFAVWYGRNYQGYAVALFGVFSRMVSMSTATQHRPLLDAWNITLEVSVLVGVAVLANQFKTALMHERAHARVDTLTGALSRRGFLEIADRELARALRYKTHICVVLMDVDRFKKVNDTQGHEAGDRLLRHLAEGLKKNARTMDVVARWGGDEFVLMLPDTDAEAAQVAFYRIKESIRGLLETWDVGLSAGVAEVMDLRLDDAIHQADLNMYAMKNRGKPFRAPANYIEQV